MSYGTSYKLQMKFLTAEDDEDAPSRTWTFSNIDDGKVSENSVLSLATTMTNNASMYEVSRRPVVFVSGTLITASVVAVKHSS